jgi:hypothetical protein
VQTAHHRQGGASCDARPVVEVPLANRRHLARRPFHWWGRVVSDLANADLLVENRFAIVPEWLLDADIGDAAVRLSAVLLRYGNSSGARMPSRSTLARRLCKRSTDSVDRAMKELVGIGTVQIEHRYEGGQRLTNAYRVRTSRPAAPTSPTPTDADSRKSAATRSRRGDGDRKNAAGLAADAGITKSTSPKGPPPPHRGPGRATPTLTARRRLRSRAASMTGRRSPKSFNADVAYSAHPSHVGRARAWRLLFSALPVDEGGLQTEQRRRFYASQRTPRHEVRCGSPRQVPRGTNYHAWTRTAISRGWSERCSKPAERGLSCRDRLAGNSSSKVCR